jgi:hypothetical protein
VQTNPVGILSRSGRGYLQIAGRSSQYCPDHGPLQVLPRADASVVDASCLLPHGFNIILTCRCAAHDQGWVRAGQPHAALARFGWRSPHKGAKGSSARHLIGNKEDAVEAKDAAAGPGVFTYKDGDVLSTVFAPKLSSRLHSPREWLE